MKKEQIKKVLILGSGGLSIGQAGEFDYSGTQAIKALKEEGIKTVLVNPNIATIQTSKHYADEVYFLPLQFAFLKKIIEKERPNGLLLSFGGQTALNCGLELNDKGVLKKYNVKILGTPAQTIEATEDKGLFAKKLHEISVKVPKSITVQTLSEGLAAAQIIGYPLIIRAGFALGGLGSGFCKTKQDVEKLLSQALSHSKQVLVEESLKGWKEVEYEVMRDYKGNAVTICNMENFDPLGIHTGESIVIAPSQTLTDHEYQKLRRISLDVVEHLEIVGECNVQFALDPRSDDYRVIEVNARLSRSSALASKATGYPLAFLAAKLALRYSLPELPNPVTKVTKAFFEPALDYCVVKFPRWDTEKFHHVEEEIGSSMKSVGEVMAIGRSFEEALQKSVRMIRPSMSGVTDPLPNGKKIEEELRNPTHKRLFAIVDALRKKYSVDKIHTLTRIDKWFLYKLNNIVQTEALLKKKNLKSITLSELRAAKQMGFSDKRLAKLLLDDDTCRSEMQVRRKRIKLGVIPFINQIDTLAAEYPAKTNYLYLTYHARSDDISITNRSIILLGSGAYSIGSSVEFDWCSVECAKALKAQKVPTVIVNYNPETVSTDYDESDRLYFDELTLERVLDIYDKENAKGIIVSFGGQIPNNLALQLSEYGVNILGNTPATIDKVEDRHKFSSILDKLGIDQPEWIEAANRSQIKAFCKKVGYPVLIRPSYVLSGAAMNVAYSEGDLDKYLKLAADISNDHPAVITKFVTGAKEIDMDVVAQEGEVKAYAISEHVENAGVHSGDATLLTPAQNLYLETMRRIKKICKQIISHLNITGPVNFQFLAKDNHIKIIECNIRASRSFPFVSKVYNINFIELATKAILKKNISKVDTKAFDLDYLGVKAPQFSFTRLGGADPTLGVEMASTGEVACLGEDKEEAFLKAFLAAGNKIPKNTILLSTGDIKQKARFLDSIKSLKNLGFELFATPGTHDFYNMHGIKTNKLHWPLDKNSKPNVLDYLKSKKLDLVINIPKSYEKEELSNDYIIRRTSADFNIPLITNLQCSILFVDSIMRYTEDDLKVLSWREYYETSS